MIKVGYTIDNAGEIEALRKLIIHVKFKSLTPELSIFARSDFISKLIIDFQKISLEIAQKVQPIDEEEMEKRLYIDEHDELMQAVKQQIAEVPPEIRTVS